MGNDFIREESGKPWRKRWDKGVDRLKLPSLFDVQFSIKHRTITADIDAGVSLYAGEQLIVQCQAGDAIISRGQCRIGVLSSMPADMRAAITGCGGVALGIVERVSLFGNNAELTVR